MMSFGRLPNSFVTDAWKKCSEEDMAIYVVLGPNES